MSEINNLSNLEKTRLDFNCYNITKEGLIGFIEAEGTFYGNTNQVAFEITQHLSDGYLIDAIAKFINYGKVRTLIRKDGRLLAILTIYNRDILKSVIIPLCGNNFHSQKKILQFKNWIERFFPEIEIKSLQLVNNKEIDKQGLIDFVDGDESFFSSISRNSGYKIGFQIKAVFDIAQINTEKELLDKIGKSFFSNFHKGAISKKIQHLRITNISVLSKIVEPLFFNSLKSRKCFDFVIGRSILKIIVSKRHLTKEGLTEIKRMRSLQSVYRYKLSKFHLN